MQRFLLSSTNDSQANARRSAKTGTIILTFALIVFLSCSFLIFAAVQLTNVRSEHGLFALQSEAVHPTTISTTVTTSAAAESQSSSSFWYVGASSMSGGSNNGVRSFIQVRDQNNRDGVVSFWISEAFENNLWAQVGYYIQSGSQPVGFYQIWSLNNRSEISTGTTKVTDGIHEFAILHGNNTTWQFVIDSKVFGSFNMQTNSTSSSYPIYAMSEEGYTNEPFAFSQVMFSRAIQVLNSGNWYNVPSAVSFGTAWGIDGRVQSSQLLENQFVVGGSTRVIAANAELWSA